MIFGTPVTAFAEGTKNGENAVLKTNAQIKSVAADPIREPLFFISSRDKGVCAPLSYLS
jgi:hypothetical protein